MLKVFRITASSSKDEMKNYRPVPNLNFVQAAIRHYVICEHTTPLSISIIKLFYTVLAGPY